MTASASNIEQASALAMTPARVFWRKARRHPILIIGAVIFLLILVVALLAPWLAPYDPAAQDMLNRVTPPVWMERGTWAHVLGTDGLGRDYLSRLIYGARISLLIGISAVIASGLIGITLGVVAGYFGGKVDLVINYLIMTRLTLPVVMVGLAVVSVVGSSLTIIVLVLGLLLWDRFAIVTRSATMQLREQEFILASRSMGSTVRQILSQEILPNLIDKIAVIATFEIAHAILLEATLSFLGLGVRPPTPSWGLMIAEARQFLLFDPWLMMIPGAALFILVISINFVGDGLRDVAAPDTRN